jgi:prevent-host-death family protein
MKVSVANAKNKLPELIRVAESGELVTICRHGVPVVDLTPTRKVAEERRKFGTLKRKHIVSDPDWWKPMSEEEAEEFICGR